MRSICASFGKESKDFTLAKTSADILIIANMFGDIERDTTAFLVCEYGVPRMTHLTVFFCTRQFIFMISAIVGLWNSSNVFCASLA